MGRPRKDYAKRQLRVDLGGVDEETARRLLDEHRAQIRAVVTPYERAAALSFFVIDRDELVAIAEAALLEAWVRYCPGDLSQERVPGSGWRAWAERIIRWRCAEYVTHVREQHPDAAARRDAANGVLRYAVDPDEVPLDEGLYRAELSAWLRAAIGQLPPRQRVILIGVSRGEEKTQLARELGISRRTVHIEYAAALATLREQAARQGLDGVALAG